LIGQTDTPHLLAHARHGRAGKGEGSRPIAIVQMLGAAVLRLVAMAYPKDAIEHTTVNATPDAAQLFGSIDLMAV